MKVQEKSASSARQKEFARLRAQLAKIGWISEGYVQQRTSEGKGTSYPWTRKVKGKTLCVALSQEQYEWLKQAIDNWHVVQEILRQMQRLSREELFTCLPNPKRRKELSKEVLGLV